MAVVHSVESPFYFRSRQLGVKMDGTEFEAPNEAAFIDPGKKPS